MAENKKVLSTSDVKNLEEIIEKIDPKKKIVAKKLLTEIKFYNKTLKKLKKKVDEDGVVVTMPQGDYEIERENPALKSYNTSIKNYQNLLKQLSELFGDLPPENIPDELEEFCK